MVFGGSEDNHQILKRSNFKYYRGVKQYTLNDLYKVEPGEAKWRVAAKWLLRRTRGRLSSYARNLQEDAKDGVGVQEEYEYRPDILPQRSPFVFRFAPTLDYLAWRYDLRLPFIRYRLFRIMKAGKTSGYAILNDRPGRLIVAQCDGEDPSTLARGVLLSIMAASRDDREPRDAFLTSCHREQSQIFRRFGFKESKEDRPFVLGAFQRDQQLPGLDTSAWLVNFDMGDNCLRPPFIDSSAAR
jgi:hypothetical protein